MPDLALNDHAALTIALQLAITSLAMARLEGVLQLTVDADSLSADLIPWLTVQLHKHGDATTLEEIDVTFS